MVPNMDIHAYLDASGDAAKHTRLVMLVMVVTSVLTSISLLNSLQSSWMTQRLASLKDPNSPYLISQIGSAPPALQKYQEEPLEKYRQAEQEFERLGKKGVAPDKEEYLLAATNKYERDWQIYLARYNQLYAAFSRGHIESSFLVHVPFFGISFDINDLGILSGIAFSIVIIWFRFATRAEIQNVRLGFSAAKDMGQLPEFYRLLAMRQVMTAPKLLGRKLYSFYLYTPKFLIFLPFIVYCLVVAHDFYTAFVGQELSDPRTRLQLCSNYTLWIVVLFLTIQAFTRWQKIAIEWAVHWREYVVTEWNKDPQPDYLKALHECLGKRDFGQPLSNWTSVLGKARRSDERIFEYVAGDTMLRFRADEVGNLVSVDLEKIPSKQLAAKSKG